MILRPITRLPHSLPTARRSQFAPGVLFAAGEQGGWWDPSDFSTMYQDSAGTTPVTAVGQLVGLMLDKRLGAVRGADTVTNGNFDSNITGWATSSGTPSTPTWAAGELQVACGGAGTNGRTLQAQTCVVGQWYEVTAGARVGTATSVQLFISNSDTGANAGLGASTATTSTSSAAHRFIFQATATTHYIVTAVVGANGTTGFFDNIAMRSVAGNHRTQATAASRPTLRQDASGFHYLEYDGVDDSMATGSVDFSATDKMTVWAGVNKQSDAAGYGIVVELGDRGSLRPGSFSLTAPDAAGTPSYLLATEGAAIASNSYSDAAVAAPVSNVLTSQLDLSAGTAAGAGILRVNGAVVGAASGAAPGGGNFGNYPLYFGRRGGSTLPFNGREYCTIIRGAATSDSQIARVERFVASRMGVSL